MPTGVPGLWAPAPLQLLETARRRAVGLRCANSALPRAGERSLQGRRGFRGAPLFPGEIAVRIEMITAVVGERIHRDFIICAPAGKMTVGRDKFRRIEVITEILLELRAAHADLQVFANLEMQMGVILAVRGPHGGDLLAARDLLPATHQ